MLYAVPGALIGIALVYLEGIRRERRGRAVELSPTSDAERAAASEQFRLVLGRSLAGWRGPALRSPIARRAMSSAWSESSG